MPNEDAKNKTTDKELQDVAGGQIPPYPVQSSGPVARPGQDLPAADLANVDTAKAVTSKVETSGPVTGPGQDLPAVDLANVAADRPR